MSEGSSEEEELIGEEDLEEEEEEEVDEKADEEEEEVEQDEDVDTEEKLIQQKLQRKREHTIPENPKKLSKELAGNCLTMLGKTGNAIEYAYLKIEAINLDLNDISIITTFKYVEFVDVSQNHLTTEGLSCVAELKNLVMLTANGNIVKTLDFPLMPFLQVLILSNNDIAATTGLKQPILQTLNLNHNLITRVEDLDPIRFENLKHLELRGNALTTTSGISLVNLHSLYLADNLISRLEGLHNLMNLLRLHLRDNRLVNLDGFSSSMKKLKYLNIRNNLIGNAMEVKKLNVLPALETVVLLENPFTLETEEEYRVEVLVHLPKLKRLDKDPVQNDEIDEAEARRAERDAMEGEEDNEEESSNAED